MAQAYITLESGDLQSIAGRKHVWRTVRNPRYTGKISKTTAGNEMFMWEGFIILIGVVACVYGWSTDPTSEPYEWSDDSY